MICLRKRTWHRPLALLAALATMILAVSSCGTPAQTTTTPTKLPQKNHGNVVIFTPSDGLALTRHKPLSTWDRLVPELVKGLKNKGFNDTAIVTKTSSSLAEQSQDVQDYVVNLLTPLQHAGKNRKATKHSDDANTKLRKQLSKNTLVIAPWSNKNGNNNYGDYATLPAALEQTPSPNVTSQDKQGDDTHPQQNDKQSHKDLAQKSADQAEDKQTQDQENHKRMDSFSNEANSAGDQSAKNALRAEKRLATSLQLAKKAGVHVIMIARTVPGFQPDVLFHLSDAKSIGETQAATLVQKLALDRATQDNPRYIEVLLPCHNQKNINAHASTQTNKNTESNGNHTESTNEDNPLGLDDEFAKEAFSGIWKVLRPYFASGTLLSSSGTLHTNSTENDWMNVAFDADDPEAVKKELTNRITANDHQFTPSLRHVDGIIAMDDQIALQTAKTLSDLGYEGSAADINPSFTLPDVIGNFIGKRNLTKRPVPAPKNSPNHKENQEQADTEAAKKDDSQLKQWPAITGYGAYKNIMPNIVNGKQWMTTIENQAKISQDIVATCDSLNTTGKLSRSIATTPTNLGNGVNVPTIYEQLLAVSATNLKARLIDPGYISLADAGL
ncbi:hypothetical protein [Gardnerella sp. KA00747]|uniref:hypothetical protein n=1 Tax=Gardnerella sp. KA00747 TaxID=2749078 RepID=UPI003BAB995E